MTTETLKPFLSTSRCADNSISMPLNTTRRYSRSINIAAIVLSTIAVILTLCLLVVMIVHIQQTSHIDAEVEHLKNIMFRMQDRLGLTNLEDDGDYGNEHNPVFIDKPKKIISNEDSLNIEDYGFNKDDDEDYENEDYQDFKNGLSVTDYDSDNENGDVVEDDIINSKAYIDDDDTGKNEQEMDIEDEGDFFSDFSKFNATLKEKKSARRTRSIEPVHPVEDHYKHDSSQFKNIRTRQDTAGVTSKDYNKPKNLLALGQSFRREDEASEIDFEPTTRTKEQRPRKLSSPRHSHKRKHKNNNLKSAKSGSQMRTNTITPAAHFHLVRKIPDRYSTIKIDSFSGDMYIGHPSWSNEIAVDNYFKVENGALTVYEPGLYYVYAQVCYNNTHDQNGFVIFHGNKPFLQCLNTVPTNIIHKIHTCHTSGLIYLRENETIHLRDFHSDRNVILKDANNRSYFGLIKI